MKSDFEKLLMLGVLIFVEFTSLLAHAEAPRNLEEALLNYTWEWTNPPRPPGSMRFYADGTARAPEARSNFGWLWKITGPRTAIVNTPFNVDGKPSTWRVELKFDETFSGLEGTAIDKDHNGHKYIGRRMAPISSAESVPASVTAVYKPDQSPIEILKEQGPNISAWVSSTLDTPIPEAIWENMTFLKEALRDEAAQKPRASTVAYGAALRLCAVILDDLAERKVTVTKAGGDGVMHQSSQLTESRRDHLTWPMYALERDERGDRHLWAQQHKGELVDWAKRTNDLRYDLGVWYNKFREALRQGPAAK